MRATIRRLMSDTRVNALVTSVRPPHQSEEVIALATDLGIAFVKPFDAVLADWDLIVFADHFAARHFQKKVPKVLFPHGIEELAPVSNGEGYQYAYAHHFDEKHSPFYAIIFEASHSLRNRVVDRVPQLATSIRVVGSLLIDEMLQFKAQRSEIRRRLGIADDETVVLISGAHGSESTWSSIGKKLMDEVVKLTPRYKFILTAHPHHWDKAGHGGGVVGQWLKGFCSDKVIVHLPSEDLSTYLVAADLAVADYSSIGIYYMFLDLPTLFIPLRENVISSQSTLWRFYLSSPKLVDVTTLEDSLQGLRDRYPKSVVESLKAEVTSHIGGSQARVMSCLYRELNLSELRH